MLMGAFAGDRKTLEISESNPLKYYENPKVFRFNDAFIKASGFADPSFRPYHGQEFSLTLPLPKDRQHQLDVRPLPLSASLETRASRNLLIFTK